MSADRVRGQLQPHIRDLLHGAGIVENQRCVGRQLHQPGIPGQTGALQEVREGDLMLIALRGDLPGEHRIDHIRRQTGGTHIFRGLLPGLRDAPPGLFPFSRDSGPGSDLAPRRQIAAPGHPG